jgi:hypothetical protein
MDQAISMLILMLGIILTLSVVNTFLSVISKINMRNIFIVALIMGAGFLFIKVQNGEIDPETGITAAVIAEIDKAVPEYVDSGEKCSQIEEKEKLGEAYKDQVCKQTCGEQRSLGHRCSDDKFFCKCW